MRQVKILLCALILWSGSDCLADLFYEFTLEGAVLVGTPQRVTSPFSVFNQYGATPRLGFQFDPFFSSSEALPGTTPEKSPNQPLWLGVGIHGSWANQWLDPWDWIEIDSGRLRWIPLLVGGGLRFHNWSVGLDWNVFGTRQLIGPGTSDLNVSTLVTGSGIRAKIGFTPRFIPPTLSAGLLLDWSPPFWQTGLLFTWRWLGSVASPTSP